MARATVEGDAARYAKLKHTRVDPQAIELRVYAGGRRPPRTLQVFIVVALGVLSAGCKWMRKESPPRVFTESSCSDGGEADGGEADDGEANDGGVTLAISPLVQAASMSAPEGGHNINSDFCTARVAVSARLTNHTASSLYVSAMGAGNFTMPYFKLNGTQLSTTTAQSHFLRPLRTSQMNTMTFVGPGESATFTIYHLCEVEPDTGITTVYNYGGPGRYTFKVDYQYTGADMPSDMGIPTFHGSVTSAEGTINAF